MSDPAAKILVSVGEKIAFIGISGRANFTSSVDFKTLMSELLQKGYERFVLDLTECALMDSTFLGVLTGFGLKMNGQQSGRDGKMVELLNPNARLAELLENLGVLHLFNVTQGNVPARGNAEPCNQVSATTSREDMTRNCLEAHQVLMNINPANASRFKEVAQFLSEDLKKLKTNP